ncbi:MAG: hypothetical protein HOH33_00070 [Verrucomicrobia bacterium]|nr:hypothetical protein [Verrucomicrobiota bacterium]
MAAHTVGALKAYTNLDAFDWSNVHRQISEVQYLQPDQPFGTFDDFDLKGFEGLIISGQYPMIDTFRAL